MFDYLLDFSLQFGNVRLHLDEVSVIITVFDGVERVSFVDHEIDFILKCFKVRIFVKSKIFDYFFGLKNGDSVLEHVILFEENVGSGKSCRHFFLNFIQFLDFLLRNGELILCPG